MRENRNRSKIFDILHTFLHRPVLDKKTPKEEESKEYKVAEDKSFRRDVVLKDLKFILFMLAIIMTIIALAFGESKYVITKSNEVSIFFSAPNYRIVEKSQNCYSLQAALNAASNGDTIQVLRNVTEEDDVIVSKSITIDLNGNSITLTNSSIINNGVLTIADETQTHIRETSGEYELQVAGSITSNINAIVNNEVLEIDGNVDIHGTGDSTYTIENLGDLTLTSGIISGRNYGALRNGTGGVKAHTKITDGTVIASKGYAISNEGVLEEEIEEEEEEQEESEPLTENVLISGTGVVVAEASKNSAGILNNTATGKIKITGGDVLTTGTVLMAGNGNPDTIKNSSTGEIEITGGNIESATAAGIAISNGDLTITGGSITGYTYGLWINEGTVVIGTENNATPVSIMAETQDGILNNTGDITIYSGTIESAGINSANAGVRQVEDGTITIGKEDLVTSISVPSISGENYGLNIEDGTVDFFDGIITGIYDAENSEGHSISAEISNVPEGYRIIKNTQIIDETTYEYAVLSNAYMTSFNANYNGASAIADKQVNYGSEYGTLPTLSRTGYTFNGWNGKNLFNKDSILLGHEINGSTIVTNNDWFVSDYIEVQAGETYTISGKTQGVAILYYDQNKENVVRGPDASTGTITIPTGKKYIRINGLLTEKDTIQIEKGSAATTYEPYFVTDTTPVTIADNHTLKAIWTANTYTVIYNANGGTGNMANQVITYDETVTLTNNTFKREGYKFTGWSTTALNTNGSTTYIDGQTVYNMATSGTVNLYAIWVAANYGEYTSGDVWQRGFITLQEAVDNVTLGYKIKPVGNVSGESAVSQTRGTAVNPIILDLNGKTISMSNMITNSGVLTITGSGTLTTSQNMYLISNTGTLNLAQTGTISHTGSAYSVGTIINTGIINKTGSGTVTSATLGSALYGGNINVSGGTVSSSGGYAINTATGSVNVTGGTVSSTSGTAIDISGSGKVTVSAGTITQSGTGVAILSSGAGGVEVSGGTITSTSGAGISASVGNVVITGGTITGSGYGLYLTNVQCTVGTNNGTVSTIVPEINATSGVGIQCGGTTTLAFYDGAITGITGKVITDSSEDAIEPTTTPEGYTMRIADNGNGTETATLSNIYTVKYPTMNLIYGLNDCDSTVGYPNADATTGSRMNYSISSGVVTVTSNASDGYGMTSGRVDLEANRKYRFSCSTNGTYGSGANDVEVFLMLDGRYTTYYRMSSNNNYEFTPTVSGTYWLRLDVNNSGSTQTFYDISMTYADKETQEYNTAYGTLPTPTRAGYTFNGWYLNAVKATTLNDNTTISTATGEIYSNNNYILSDMIPVVGGSTLYSNVSICGIYTFDSAGRYIGRESNRVTEHHISANARYMVIEICKSDDNSKTIDWYRNNLIISDYRNASNVLYINSEVTYATVDKVAGNHSLFSKWTANSYTLTINPNGGTKNGSTSARTLSSNLVYNSSNWCDIGASTDGSNAARNGYTLTGYYTASTGGIKVYNADGTAVNKCGYWTSDVSGISSNLKYIGTSNLTVYAQWSPNTYTVTYNVNGGTGGPANQSFTFNAGESLSSTVPTKVGYTFVNWKRSDTTHTFNPGDTIPSGWGSFTLVAQWQANEYTLTINPNGGTKNGSTSARTLSPNLIYNSTNWSKIGEASDGGNATRTGYTLTGYYTAATGGTKVYNADGNAVQGTAYFNSSNYYIGTSNLTVYAQWQANTYTVTFDANGGAGTMANQTLTYDTASNLTANAFTRTGYTFAGWSTSNSDKSLVYDNTEYTGTRAAGQSGYTDFKEYVIPAPFVAGEVYQMDVDVKGTGTLVNYFYGDANYLYVASWESPTTGNSGTNGDGWNPITLTNDWTHYTVRFTLSNSRDGSVNKRLLYRVFGGNTAYIKNIRFNKVSSSSTAYVDSQSVKNLATSGNVNLYAIWKVNPYSLTVNPSGGSYDGVTSNSTIQRNYGDYYTLKTPTKANSTFNTWSLSGSGSLMRGIGNGSSSSTHSLYTKTSKTENGEAYTNYYLNTTQTSNSWANLVFPTYSYTVGHTYQLTCYVRANKVSGGNFYIRHSKINNEWEGGTYSFSSKTDGWVKVTITRTFDSSTFVRGDTTYNLSPRMEVWTTNLNTGKVIEMDFDIRDIVVKDITDGSYRYTTDYIYEFGAGAGTITAQWNVSASPQGNGVVELVKLIENTEDPFDIFKIPSSITIIATKRYDYIS